MKVFVATHEGQGARSNDFCWTEDGELVHFPLIECDMEEVDGSCGCKRSLGGLKSHKATTTIQVVDLPMSQEDLAGAILTSLQEGGWNDLLNPDELAERARQEADHLMVLAAPFPVGAIVERRGDALQERMPS